MRLLEQPSQVSCCCELTRRSSARLGIERGGCSARKSWAARRLAPPLGELGRVAREMQALFVCPRAKGEANYTLDCTGRVSASRPGSAGRHADWLAAVATPRAVQTSAHRSSREPVSLAGKVNSSGAALGCGLQTLRGLQCCTIVCATGQGERSVSHERPGVRPSRACEDLPDWSGNGSKFLARLSAHTFVRKVKGKAGLGFKVKGARRMLEADGRWASNKVGDEQMIGRGSASWWAQPGRRRARMHGSKCGALFCLASPNRLAGPLEASESA